MATKGRRFWFIGFSGALGGLFSGALLAQAAPIRVIASTPGLVELVQVVGGPDVLIQGVLQAGQDPHSLSPRLQAGSRGQWKDTVLVVRNGLGLEDAWLGPLQAAQVDPLLRKNGERDFDASRNASLLAPPEGGPRLGENHPSSNPHFLLDPRNGIRVAEALEKALSQVDPTHSAGYVERFRQFQKKREAQLQAWQSRLKSWSGKVAVTDHAHLTYLWAWLGVSAQATLELAPGHPPTPAHLEKLVQEMKKRQVKVFFFESGRPESLVRVIARRTQAKALGIDPSGRESQWEPLIEALAKAP